MNKWLEKALTSESVERVPFGADAKTLQLLESIMPGTVTIIQTGTGRELAIIDTETLDEILIRAKFSRLDK